MYPCEHNWMDNCFFTGGLMPMLDTLMHFQQNLLREDIWAMDGRHDKNNTNSRLQLQRQHRLPVMAIWSQRWCKFCMNGAELFGTHAGSAWLLGYAPFRMCRPWR
jgi:cyclopropane-fatty-acyl-phospholipid synthase